MSTTLVAITCEMQLIQDTVDELFHVYDLLLHRHGDAFRALENDIMSIRQADMTPTIQYLNEGTFIAIPPSQITDLIARAKALGVI